MIGIGTFFYRFASISSTVSTEQRINDVWFSYSFFLLKIPGKYTIYKENGFLQSHLEKVTCFVPWWVQEAGWERKVSSHTAAFYIKRIKLQFVQKETTSLGTFWNGWHLLLTEAWHNQKAFLSIHRNEKKMPCKYHVLYFNIIQASGRYFHFENSTFRQC